MKIFTEKTAREGKSLVSMCVFKWEQRVAFFQDENGPTKSPSTKDYLIPSLPPRSGAKWRCSVDLSIWLVGWALNSGYRCTSLYACKSTLLRSHIASILGVVTVLSLSQCENSEWQRKTIISIRMGLPDYWILLCWVSFWRIFKWYINIFPICVHLEKSVFPDLSPVCQ